MAQAAQTPRRSRWPSSLGKRPAESGAVAPLPSNMALPNAVVQRLIKSKLPDGVMLHKDARAAFNKSTSIFILMLTTMCVPAR